MVGRSMNVIRDMRSVVLPGPSFLSIGNFDGLHRGHQALLAHSRALADRKGSGGQVGLLTFSPHPLAVLRPDFPHQILTTPDERMTLAGDAGADFGVIQPFDHDLAALSARDFVTQLKHHLGLAELVVGPDFALGRNREGDIPTLQALGQELGFGISVMAPITWQGKPVRSSLIRQTLRDGDVEETAEFLGRRYAITGTVRPGDRRGRRLGLPTANLYPESALLLPADGVYATYARVLNGAAAGLYAGVTNIGVRPTVDGLHHRVEAHLLDYTPVVHAEELYGAQIRLEFLAHLREEKRFAGLDALVAQIHADIAAARTLFAVTPPHPA